MPHLPHLKFIVAGTLIIGAISYLMFSGVNDSMVYYYDVSELMAKGPELEGKGVRLSGFVSPGSIVREGSKSKVQFLVFEKAGDRTVQVAYEGIIPDTFRDNAEVVVEGTYQPAQNSFQANTLLAKCPSKYEALGDEHPEDIPISKADTRHPAPATQYD
ncbi:MAG: cytochrome c maturation protein CcmE [Acidobacteriota bacterium]